MPQWRKYMKTLKRIRQDNKSCGYIDVELPDGKQVRLAVSYNTVIGFIDADGEHVFTDKQFTRTTSRHQNLIGVGRKGRIPHTVFVQRLNEAGIPETVSGF